MVTKDKAALTLSRLSGIYCHLPRLNIRAYKALSDDNYIKAS